MANEFAFELDVETVPEAEVAVVASLCTQLSGADEKSVVAVAQEVMTPKLWEAVEPYGISDLNGAVLQSEATNMEMGPAEESSKPKASRTVEAYGISDLNGAVSQSEATNMEMGPDEESLKPKASGTVFYWKEPSRGAKRRAKLAAAAKTAAASSKDHALAAQIFVPETSHENPIQFMRGTSHSDTDDDSGDSHLPDLSDISHSDAQIAGPEGSASAEASVAPPPAAAVLQEPQDVMGDASC